MKKVLTVGVFDYFHYGHLRLLERAKALGDYLVVAVQRDEEIHKTKPQAKILYSLRQRIEMIQALKVVDEVVEYSQIADDIAHINFDLFVRGGDQNHSGFMQAEEWCKSHNKEVIILERTPGISSTQIRQELSDKK